MGDIMILSVLKFLGLAVGLASTIWGMTTTTTSTDEAGAKRLTPAGHIAIAIAIGSFILAGASHGFETLAQQAQEREDATTALAKAAQEEARDARAFRSEQREQRTLDLANLARAEALARGADERAARAEGRVLALRTAADARERDLALSRDVNRGSADNLRQARVALGQLERLMQPIEQLEISVSWEVPLGEQFPQLREFARTWTDRTRPPGLRSVSSQDGRVMQLTFGQDFHYYPSWYAQPDVNGAVRIHSYFGLFSADVQLPETAHQVRLADIFVDMVPNPDSLTYMTASNAIIVTAVIRQRSEIRRTGRIVSVNDFDSATAVMSLFGNALAQPRQELIQILSAMKPVRITVLVSGRQYTARNEDIRVMPFQGNTPLFAARLRRVQGDTPR